MFNLSKETRGGVSNAWFFLMPRGATHFHPEALCRRGAPGREEGVEDGVAPVLRGLGAHFQSISRAAASGHRREGRFGVA